MSKLKMNQGTYAVFIWFAFLNSQLLISILCLIHWKMSNPGMRFESMVVWDPTVFSGLFTLALLSLSTLFLALGAGLAVRFFADGSSKSFTKIIVSYALIDATSMVGFVLAVTHGNAGLSFPFIGASTLALLLLYPSSGRLAGRGGID